MKFIIFSDTHLGMSSNNMDKMLNRTSEQFDKVFIPILEKKYEKGDVILHLGDLFDNRTSVNIKAINEALRQQDYFETNEMKSLIILGNHDMWGETSREFNSVNILKKYKYAKIIKEPIKKEINGIQMAFMPYITNKEDRKKILQNLSPAKYLFCHTDVLGSKIRRSSKYDAGLSEHGFEVSEFVEFDKVFSGHIHIRQELKNFTYVGCPFHQDRRDIGNKKGIYILDLDKDELEFIENKISPEYKEYIVNNEEDLNKIPLDDNSLKDVIIKQSVYINDQKLRLRLEELIKLEKIQDVKQYNDIKKEIKTVELTKTEQLDLRSVLNKSVAKQNLADDLNEMTYKLINTIFEKHKELYG